jgi:drug/metabolite transporter (DMT)-like permease
MKTTSSPYPLFSARNLPAYAAVMLLWAIVSVLLALLLRAVTSPHVVSWTSALVFSAVAVMSGMAIMFGASVVNLRKLRPAFAALAKGGKDPAIPPVWCPVLTMAIRAAVELSQTVSAGRPALSNGKNDKGQGDRS